MYKVMSEFMFCKSQNNLPTFQNKWNINNAIFTIVKDKITYIFNTSLFLRLCQFSVGFFINLFVLYMCLLIIQWNSSIIVYTVLNCFEAIKFHLKSQKHVYGVSRIFYLFINFFEGRGMAALHVF